MKRLLAKGNKSNNINYLIEIDDAGEDFAYKVREIFYMVTVVSS